MLLVIQFIFVEWVARVDGTTTMILSVIVFIEIFAWIDISGLPTKMCTYLRV